MYGLCIGNFFISIHIFLEKLMTWLESLKMFLRWLWLPRNGNFDWSKVITFIDMWIVQRYRSIWRIIEMKKKFVCNLDVIEYESSSQISLIDNHIVHTKMNILTIHCNATIVDWLVNIVNSLIVSFIDIFWTIDPISLRLIVEHNWLI